MPTAARRYCFLHRHAIFAKKIPTNVQSDAENIVTFIKSRPLQSRFFNVLWGSGRKAYITCYILKFDGYREQSANKALRPAS
jgi:hypothetical protein